MKSVRKLEAVCHYNCSATKTTPTGCWDTCYCV